MPLTCTLQGGLGNQLFIKAATICTALKYNLDYCIPTNVVNPHSREQKPYIFPGVKYCSEPIKGARCVYNEPFFHYQEIPNLDCENMHIVGYFQSFRYSEGYRDEILKAFGFKWKEDKRWCAIFVRRGDYMNLPDYHPFVGEEYLVNAMNEIKDRTGITRFKIFSNDLPWCVEFFDQFKKYEFDYLIGGSEIDDLERGSGCAHQIMSNSTYSLWGYYLNQNTDKICIAPKRWFGKLANHDLKDLYPEGAIII